MIIGADIKIKNPKYMIHKVCKNKYTSMIKRL